MPHVFIVFEWGVSFVCCDDSRVDIGEISAEKPDTADSAAICHRPGQSDGPSNHERVSATREGWRGAGVAAGPAATEGPLAALAIAFCAKALV